MPPYAPADSEISLIGFNSNIDGGGEGAWFNGDTGFLKTFFAGTLYFGIREGKTGPFAFIPDNSTAATALTTTAMDARLAHEWYLNQFGGNLISQLHFARAAAPYTAAAVVTYGAAEDALVWGTAKPINARAIMRKVADHYPNATGRFGIRVFLGPNEGDLESKEVCRLADPTARMSTSIARYIELDRARWEELRGPNAKFKHPGILCQATTSGQALRSDAGGTYRCMAYAIHNNGEVLNYIDAWATTCHHRNSGYEDGASGFYGSDIAPGTGGFVYLWRAIKAAKALNTTAALIPILATEYGGSTKVSGTNYGGTAAGEWLTDDTTLNGKNICETYRAALALNNLFYWGITHGTFYSLAFSPADQGTTGTELEKSRGAFGTMNLYYVSGTNTLAPNQPMAAVLARVWDMHLYVLPFDGIIPIPTKTWQYQAGNLDNGFHLSHNWCVNAKAYNAPISTTINAVPWTEWAQVTFPGSGEIVSAAGVKKIITRPIFLPRFTQWTIKADVQCTGGGIAQIGARGYDLLDGEALVKSANAAATYAPLTINFRPNGHSIRMPNAPRVVVTLSHNGVGEARFKNVVVYPTGTTPPNTGGTALAVTASASPTSGNSPLTVNFTSTPTDGDPPYTYVWAWGDNAAVGTTQNPSHVYAVSGTYTARVTVTDEAGATASATAQAVVVTSGSTLVATAAATPVAGDAPLSVAFTGSAAGGTSPYTYAWNFGDGGNSAVQSPTYVYNTPGTYTATLTVTDSLSIQDTSTVSIVPALVNANACLSSTTSLFLNPCSNTTSAKRPIGTGAVYANDTNQITLDWLKAGTAAPMLGISTPSSGWGVGIWDVSSTTGTFSTTITVDTGGTAAQFPVTVRLPNGFDASFNGPVGNSQNAILWDGTNFHDFKGLRTVTVGSAYVAKQHYVHAGGGQGHGGAPRGTALSGLWWEANIIRGAEWNDPATGKCEHALGVSIGSQTGHLVGAQMGPTFVWPASSGDATAVGHIPVGTRLAIPPLSKGGPDPNTLSLGGSTSAKYRMYKQASNYGWDVTEIAGAPALKSDQILDATTMAAMQTAARALYPYLRAITNVGANGSDPIGGGTPLAPNCAFNRGSSITIQPVSWWEAKVSMANDLTFWGQYYNSSDSNQYYTLGLGIDGHTAMYRATGNTIYLDRAIMFTESMISHATTQAGGYQGWLSSVDGNIEAPLREFYCWRYVVNMLEAMVGLSGTYATKYATILAFTEQNIWNKWYSRGTSNLYRQVVHIAAHSAFVADFLRRRSTNATIVSQATTVQNNIDNVGVVGYGDSLYSMMKPHPRDANAYYWQMYFRATGGGAQASQTQSDKDWGTDVSHGSGLLSYVVEMYDRGRAPWTVSDISKFTRTLAVIWPDATTFYNWIIGGTATPTPNPLTWVGSLQDGWLKLGRYDRALQKRVEGHSVAAGVQLYGNGALNAKILLTGQGTNTRSTALVSGGTIKTDTGNRLRGTTMDLRTSTSPVSSNNAYWASLRSKGINIVRYDVKTVLNGRTPAQQIPYIDVAVNNAEANRMYIMIMQSVDPGSYNKAALLDFWGQVAARYKDRKCVLYEMTNEPTNAGAYWGSAASWTTQTLKDLHDVYDAMRSAAPNTPIVLFSSANLHPTPAAWRTVVQTFEGMGAVDWTKAVVGYHHYLGTYLFGDPDGFGGLNTFKQWYPIFMTECNDFMGDGPSNDARNHTQVWLEYEQNGISWVCLDGVGGNISTQVDSKILPYLAANGFPLPVE